MESEKQEEGPPWLTTGEWPDGPFEYPPPPPPPPPPEPVPLLAALVPKTIVVRVVQYVGTQVIVEHDGKRVCTESVPGVETDPGDIVTGAEAVLKTLGYVLDRPRMYMDMSLMVAAFTKEGP